MATRNFRYWSNGENRAALTEQALLVIAFRSMSAPATKTSNGLVTHESQVAGMMPCHAMSGAIIFEQFLLFRAWRPFD